MMRASVDEHRSSGPAAYPVVAGLAAAALLAAFLMLGIGNRIADQPDVEHHHAAASVVDDLAAVLPGPVVLVALMTAAAVVLIAAVPQQPSPASARRGRAPPRSIDI